ncbi:MULTISPECIES: tRNA glutamyl-Q(34) synthetase GluQRS [unclassified Haematospirillum]|uniref:tRNA glutamyl-Q(34) synthetase GluQRS n=1 Tax=unclassified Haematospirillum TaxID=2622088 RepID=UPI0014393AF7|nr:MULTISPECIES: tRNA glutamyl-Q(34) synthetase GluQRS [unclassified Haematospirillum]NKD54561.1 tRNA glutamyl-Q(34) synthetase GluQRS [Haematospirillum sp. H4890]NKD74827.1 tRNA glutamyl-Q(34) synthetase GluQRS [Haematospirillum sp. H4485]NKD88037.1 tRNA glutamyl-Q(34) synthetase GluQRS [Haematospirillum sp. 15-248]
MPDVTRFAPSPTGYLHLGHVFSACYACRQAGPGGRFLLRIEDIDQTRCQDRYANALIDDLAWLGLSWEHPVRYQSQHLGTYSLALGQLENQGLIYPCFCTRSDIMREVGDIHRAPHGPYGLLYPGTCRSLPRHESERRRESGVPYALRLDMQAALSRTGSLSWRDGSRGLVGVPTDGLGDVVLARKDTPTSYHLAVTLDDALQGVTLVTRGEDLFQATHVHRILQALLELPVPQYHHHPLLLDPQGRRYAKRDRSVTIRSLRAAGATPQDILAMIDRKG